MSSTRIPSTPLPESGLQAGLYLCSRRVSVGLFTADGALLDSRVLPGAKSATPAEVLRSTISAARQLAKGQQIERVGMAVAGKVDTDTGTLVRAGRMTDWVGTPVRHIVSDGLNADVVLGNDVVGLMLLLTQQNPVLAGKNLIYVRVGTGIGASLASWDSAVNSHSVTGVELGHMGVTPPKGVGDIQCPCGEVNCLETFSGGHRIENLSRQSDGTGRPTTQQWETVVDPLAEQIAKLILSQSPSHNDRRIGRASSVDHLILGGAQFDSHKLLYGRIKHALRQHLPEASLPDLMEDEVIAPPAAGLALLSYSDRFVAA